MVVLRCRLGLGVAVALALAGCDPVVDAGYRGEPLFGFDAQVVSFQGLQSQGYEFRVSLFWVRDLGARLDPSALSEQASVAVDIAFPASVAVRVFAPPTAAQRVAGTDLGVGLVLVYEDRDRDGRFTPGLSPSELVGGAPYEAIVYVPDAAALAAAPFDDDLAVGFQTVRLPLVCSSATGLATCDVPLGAACEADADCGPGPGTCVHELDGASWPGGACAIDLAVASCLAPGDAALVTNVEGTAGYWVAGCFEGLGCREGYACDAEVFGCLPAGDAVRAAGFGAPGLGACEVAVGAPCVADGDCGGPGVCFVRSAGQSFVGGYCVVPVGAACAPDGAREVPWSSYDETPTHWMKACADDADCRVGDGYLCDAGWEVCLPEGPIELELGEDLLVTPICIGLGEER